MSPTSRATALAALALAFAVASCAYQPPATPFAIDQDGAPSAMPAGPTGQGEKRLSALGSDGDCVLTTPDIHLWCKSMIQYY
jgi:hypothetical protein